MEADTVLDRHNELIHRRRINKPSIKDMTHAPLMATNPQSANYLKGGSGMIAACLFRHIVNNTTNNKEKRAKG